MSAFTGVIENNGKSTKATKRIYERKSLL